MAQCTSVCGPIVGNFNLADDCARRVGSDWKVSHPMCQLRVMHIVDSTFQIDDEMKKNSRGQSKDYLFL